MTRAERKSPNPREVELKLQLLAGSRDILEACAIFADAMATHHHQVTTYFDTPDGVLGRAGFALRVRQADGSHTQAVKSGANRRGIAMDRREWEWPVGRNTPELTHLARTKELAGFVQAIEGKLIPVFLTDIHRTTRLLHLESNTIVEAAIDMGRIKAGKASEEVCELELELKAGRPGPMYQLAIQLQSLAPMWVSAESKSARGWHLRTGQTEGAAVARTPRLGRRVRAAEGFSRIIAGTLGHLISNIAPTLRGDPEGIHQMRTALRASRAALELFAPRLDALIVGQFDAELKSFGRLFGVARDWDVFCLYTLPAAMAELPAERLWDMKQAAESERQNANAVVLDTVCGQHFTAMVLGLVAWAEDGAAQPYTFGAGPMGKRLAILAPALLSRVATKAKKREQCKGKLSAEARHRLRKALDRLCDDVKFLTRIFPCRELPRYRDKCEQVQVILGLANDTAVARRLVLTLIADGRLDLNEPGDALVQWSNQKSRNILHHLDAALRDFGGVAVFW